MAIHWDITKLDYYNEKSRWRATFVWVTCENCGQQRWWHRGYLRQYLREKPEYNGICRLCAAHNSPRYKGGTTIKNDGYNLMRPNHFTEEELKILEPMWPEAFWYIRGNRAAMALHLGRPLRHDEIVHHKNGDRSDDRIENLELLKRDTHHNGHGDTYYQQWQEALSEIQVLKTKITYIEEHNHLARNQTQSRKASQA